jgi:hypothetical protein
MDAHRVRDLTPAVLPPVSRKPAPWSSEPLTVLASAWRSTHQPVFSKGRGTAPPPIAALHVWDSGSRLQIRLQADVTIITGADTAEAWSAVPDRSRLAYSSDHRPGQPIPSALAYEQTPDPQVFAVLHLNVRVMGPLRHSSAPACRRSGAAAAPPRCASTAVLPGGARCA